MKRLFQILAMATFISSLQGCSDSNDTEINQFKELELKFSGNINALRPASRVNANGFEVNDNIGFYISNTQTLKQNGNILDNEKFVNAGDVLVAPKNKEVYWHSSDVRYSVWAYYPYIENINNYKEINLLMAADQTDEATYFDNDFLVVNKRDIAPQEAPVELTFDHAMSKIAIKLIAGDNITEEELQNATKSLRIENVIIDGTINLENSTCTTGSTVATITPYNEDGLNYAAIVFPQQNRNIKFTMEMNGDTYVYNTTRSFQQGRQHNFEFTVDKWDPLQMKLSALKISNWTNIGNAKGKLSWIIQFKDPKFKECILSQAIEIRHESYGNVWYEYVSYDTDGDGELSIEEAKAITEIDIKNIEITDLSDLKYFPNLEILSISGGQFPDIPIDYTTKLKKLSIIRTTIESLNLSKYTTLTEIICHDNYQLTSLEVSNNKNIVSLDCKSNALETLNISNCTALEHLICSYNYLSALNISSNTKLIEIDCYNNQLTSLDVSNNKNIVSLDCRYNALETLDMSNNAKLTELLCDNNQLTSLNISNNTELTTLSCSNNKLTSLYVGNNSRLLSLQCSYNHLPSLDVSLNKKIQGLRCNNNYISQLHLDKMTDLYYFDCNNNFLKTLDISNCLKLQSLQCNPMNDENGNNILSTIYMAKGQYIYITNIPTETEIIYK